MLPPVDLSVDLRDAVGDRLFLSDGFRRDGTKFDIGQATTLKEHAEAEPESTPKIVGGCPVRILREVQPDGTELYLGDLGVSRCGFPHGREGADRERLSAENDAREVGDESIVWCLGGMPSSSQTCI